MRSSLTSITPDALSGAIFALEGVKHATVLLNGPTGCKFYHSAIADSQLIRQDDFDPLSHPETWYFGQPQVPCTYLDNGDYVYGSADKLTEALRFHRDHVRSDLICVVNSPGASLIGDDLQGIVRQVMGDAPVVALETTGFSSDVCHGHEKASIALMETLLKDVEPYCGCGDLTVNLLGLSLFQRNLPGDVAELRRLLGLMGVRVNCALAADCTVDEVRALPRAALNVVVRPEYGLGQAAWLKERFGMPSYVCRDAVIGFAATERLVRDLAQRLSADAAPALADIERARATAYAHISRLNSITGKPQGVPFSAEGDWSELLGYLEFLVDYLGMLPVCLAPTNPGADACAPDVRRRLGELGLARVLEEDVLDAPASVVLASGNTLAQLKVLGREVVGIETALPTLGYINVIPKTFTGVRGALQLLELVLNAVV